ncbi:hypothetical protein CYMTET_50793 [Cymbomonas tetramitiformis]|uniref:Uncharacterized protein n=1 Tax=Cymbomonas tetramitiformis TaxID=36881 RepID=A0AAE0ET27_9CHLO|nr:hypothetical protein CYMTET_50793 [Cymbomonas tetramitiformis]
MTSSLRVKGEEEAEEERVEGVGVPKTMPCHVDKDVVDHRCNACYQAFTKARKSQGGSACTGSPGLQSAPPRAPRATSNTTSDAREAVHERGGASSLNIGVLTPDEKEAIAKKKRKARRTNTSKAHKTGIRRWEHFREFLPIPPYAKRTEKLSECITDDIGIANLTRCLEWIYNDGGVSSPGLEYARKADKLTLKVFEKVHSSLQHTFEEQLLLDGNVTPKHEKPKLTHNIHYCATIKEIDWNLRQQTKARGVDPQKRTAMRTMTIEQLQGLLRRLINLPGIEAARDLAIATYSIVSLSRSDEVRAIYLPDFVAPRVMPNIGPCLYKVVPVVVRECKTMEHGEISYTGSGRHSSELACFHGGNGRYLVIRFGKEKGDMGDIIPNPKEDPEGFMKLAMFHGYSEDGTISYTQMATNFAKHFADESIDIETLLHSFRILGSIILDDQGLELNTVLRMGHWLHTALTQSYLKFSPADGLLGAGWWPNAAKKDFDTFWHPRFFPDVMEIVKEIAPWIFALEETFEKFQIH